MLLIEEYFYLHSILAILGLDLLISALIRTQSYRNQTNNKNNYTHKEKPSETSKGDVEKN